ncbi:zinc-ribbon domain-containing protein [Bacillota bacterium LCP21S3_G6]
MQNCQTSTCPSCGKSVPAGTKFCSYCGAPMKRKKF